MNELQTSASSSVDGLLGEILDDFLQRQGQGEQPDAEEYARRHPEIASILRQMLPTFQGMCVPAGNAAAPAEASAPAGYVPGYLGDYRILREVGRGGMGIVYEAEQVSLGRKVALKVLPFAAAMDAKHLQRFKNEAQAAAQLHHQHIVPVYGVGCERGTHYYAMQYIEGPTVAALIHELAQRRAPAGSDAAASPPAPAERHDRVGPDTGPIAALPTEHSAGSPAFFRTVAQLGVQAAEALEHAHDLGVVHRDVKPANLLVSVRGHLWITDFGLARLQNDMGLTLTGDLLGTLRYMSPEQALAKHGLVDHRTDIYSLGATLYELLTLQPACPGKHRQEVLRQIEEEEPLPPGRLCPAIPADLETIVLKALAKEPDSRYATAQELANDLRRFLEDKPIRAKRPTAWQRGRKWVRRHQGMVVTAGVAAVLALLTVVAALVVGILRVEKERRRTEDEHQAALAARKRDDETFRLAREALEECVRSVREDERVKSGQLEELRRAVAQAEAHFYEKFVQLRGDEPEFRTERGRAFFKLGAVTQQLGKRDDAMAAYEQALQIFIALVHEHPEVLEHRATLARIHLNRGVVFLETGRRGEAAQAFQEALALQKLVAAEPRSGPEAQRVLVLTCGNLGVVCQQTGKPKEAEQAYREAVDRSRNLVRDYPAPAHQYVLAGSGNNLAALYLRTGRLQEAERLFQESRTLGETLVDAYPKNPAYQAALAGTYNNLGEVYQKTGRLCEAEQTLREALALKQALVQEHPLVTSYAVDLGGTQAVLGEVTDQSGRPEAALDWLDRAVATLEDVLVKEPRHAKARASLGTAYQSRLVVRTALCRYSESLHDSDRILELL